LERETSEPRLFLLREFDTEEGAGGVPDPYFGGPEGFEEVYQIVERCCRALLERIVEEATVDAAL
jgi:protein-tyrosine phosphatase